MEELWPPLESASGEGGVQYPHRSSVSGTSCDNKRLWVRHRCSLAKSLRVRLQHCKMEARSSGDGDITESQL